MNLLAICIALFDDTVFTNSRPILQRESNDRAHLLSSFAHELGCDSDDIDSILIVKNNLDGKAPQIVKHWTAENGDFG